MKKHYVIAICIFFLSFVSGLAQKKYQPNWESLNKRPNPSWFKDAKFGIFIHWGVYSVPAWAPKGTYSEWYWNSMLDVNNPTRAFHQKMFGESFQYQDFAPLFKAELYDPDLWADIFLRSGARYVVTTSKHHDGYCLWPSAESWNWNSMDVGPHRDLIGDLTDAVRVKGLKMGLYYSLYEWYHPLYNKTDIQRYVSEHMIPQFKDVVERYKPSIIFADGEWDYESDVWHTEKLMAWLFNESSCGQDVVINDRWGKGCRGINGGYFTTEYAHVFGEMAKEFQQRGWEENRGIGASFGYNRNEDIADYQSTTDLIHMLIEIVAKGGNLLLDIGPTADGRIPVIMQERLLQIGSWLKVNGEAIYETKPYGKIAEGDFIRFTKSKDDQFVYAIALKWPGEKIRLESLRAVEGSDIVLLGENTKIEWNQDDYGLEIICPTAMQQQDKRAAGYAYAFKIRLKSLPFISLPEFDHVGGRVDQYPVAININTIMKNTDIFYTLDGTEPTIQSPKYTGPFQMNEPGMLHARAFKFGAIASDIKSALFLAKENGINYKYYEGAWKKLPDFEKLKPVKYGIAENFDIELRERDDYWGFEFFGYVQILIDGVYTFYCLSDDGSRLYIGDQLLVDNDGTHGRIEKSGSISLETGFVPIKVQYFEDSVGQDLEVYYQGPDIKKQRIPTALLYNSK
jgi:alpha-L-fucosidase